MSWILGLCFRFFLLVVLKTVLILLGLISILTSSAQFLKSFRSLFRDFTIFFAFLLVHCSAISSTYIQSSVSFLKLSFNPTVQIINSSGLSPEPYVTAARSFLLSDKTSLNLTVMYLSDKYFLIQQSPLPIILISYNFNRSFYLQTLPEAAYISIETSIVSFGGLQ